MHPYRYGSELPYIFSLLGDQSKDQRFSYRMGGSCSMGQNCHLSLVSLNPSQSFNFSPWSSDQSVGFHIISHPLQLDGCITSIANRRKDITEVQLSHGWVPFIRHAWVPATTLNHGRVQFYCYLSSISRGAAAGLSSQ